MAAVYLSPVYGAGAQLFTSQGVVLSGGTINTFVAGTTTPQITYTDKTGLVSNGTQIVLDSAGRTPQEIWIPAGVAIKIVVQTSTGVQVGTTWDNISGVNDPSGGTPVNTEWVTAGTPTFVDATHFSLVGDVRVNFPVGQRVRYTVTAGTGYATVTGVAYTSVTSVTVQTDSVPLDSGLSVVAYGLFNAANPSVAAQGVAYSSMAADTTVPSVGNTLKRVDRGDALTTTTGSSTAFVLTPSVPLGAYATNAPLLAKFHVTGGASPTMNVSGLGALNLKQVNSVGAKVAATPVIGQLTQIVYDGTDLVVMDPIQTGIGLLRITPITTPGSGTWTRGTGTNYILIKAVGGGAGASTPGGLTGGGGGAGAYCEKLVTAPNATETYTVGAGGAAGSAGTGTVFGAYLTAGGGNASSNSGGGTGGTGTGGTSTSPAEGVALRGSFLGGTNSAVWGATPHLGAAARAAQSAGVEGRALPTRAAAAAAAAPAAKVRAAQASSSFTSTVDYD